MFWYFSLTFGVNLIVIAVSDFFLKGRWKYGTGAGLLNRGRGGGPGTLHNCVMHLKKNCFFLSS